jgi:hypothetical protein
MSASDQIRQMVNFILQEAHEKANEIRVKVRRHYDASRRADLARLCLHATLPFRIPQNGISSGLDLTRWIILDNLAVPPV